MGAGNAYTPARAGFVGDTYTLANETADLVSLNMAGPLRSVSDMRDNPKTINRSGVHIYNSEVLKIVEEKDQVTISDFMKDFK